MKVGFVTSTGYPELTPDDRLAADALRDQGLDVEPVIWTDSGDRWRVLDGLVVRSPWDYHLAPDRFLSWIDRVQATGLPLWNPPGILRWNLNKGYLRTVEAWGFPIPPTRWIGRGSATPLVEHSMALGTDEAVIKPVIGASAQGVIRVTRASLADGEAHLRQILGSGDAMVQAFAPEVESAGEWSLVFLGGKFSHAVVKTPRAGDFRVQHWAGALRQGGRISQERGADGHGTRAAGAAALPRGGSRRAGPVCRGHPAGAGWPGTLGLHFGPMIWRNPLSGLTARNKIALLLSVASIALLLPGLLRPMITISASIDAFGKTREIFRQTQSILQAVKSLHESGNDFVAGLILLFSMTVPFVKAVLLFPIMGLADAAKRYRLYRLVSSISKWSMADVFVVGVFIAMLAARATDNLDASVESGFYFFTGYCLISNLAFQLLKVDPSPSSPN
jgi:hypothetical protein